MWFFNGLITYFWLINSHWVKLPLQEEVHLTHCLDTEGVAYKGSQTKNHYRYHTKSHVFCILQCTPLPTPYPHPPPPKKKDLKIIWVGQAMCWIVQNSAATNKNLAAAWPMKNSWPWTVQSKICRPKEHEHCRRLRFWSHQFSGSFSQSSSMADTASSSRFTKGNKYIIRNRPSHGVQGY